jgi:hypothetical protein
MDKRMILNGTGTYFFTVRGAKDAPIFRSVFEYEYFRNILAQEKGCELIAYVFSEYEARWVMRCEQDWQVILDNLRAHMQELHFKHWHKHQQILSESAEVIFVEEDRYLVPLVMEMHHWPVRKGLVASPDVYPWSSDKFYRDVKQPAWLASDRMLKRMTKQRSNTVMRYERMMEQFTPWNTEEAKNPLYKAFASNSYIALHLRKKKSVDRFSEAQIIALRAEAEKLISGVLGGSIEQVNQPRSRRQYNQIEPLAMWLLLETGCSIQQMSFIFDLDETILQGWIRSLPNQHPESFLIRIKQAWQEQGHANSTLIKDPEIKDVDDNEDKETESVSQAS